MTDDLQLDNIMLDAWADAQELIASESFLTDNNGFQGIAYQGDVNFGDGVNTAVTVGNAGFANRWVWLNSNSRFQPANAASLAHPGVVAGTRQGYAKLSVSNFGSLTYRNTQRKLAAAPPVTNAYYLSGLIRVNALDLKDGEAAAVGFNSTLAQTVALSDGFHFGVSKEGGLTYLSAFAGTQTFPLMELDEPATGRVWQVTLKLAADARGMDALTAWYAPDDARRLTLAFKDVPVETYSEPASLRSLRLTTRAMGRNGTDSDAATLVHVDEIRLGVSLESVTALPDARPPKMIFLLK